ncbi:histidine phosphatase family protein [Salinibacterium sp. ZJ450]|uniref:SixA phosphatase family protein n=1 Tax=Salinibacterium sp. ZJ450 TaxID=2708338 RepID=UPI00142166C0|nr:histidine phosphatase family protein [Salinibacterium sp. ZJ450]
MTKHSERTLILLRHAKSDRSGNEPDVARPLAKRGQREAPEAGRWLAEQVDSIDLAIVSPATRARDTWELASAEFDTPPSVRFDERVYAASAKQLLGVVRELPDDVHTIVLVGHNPAMEELASLLAGDDVSMPTSALAVFRVRASWAALDSDATTLTASGRADGSALT